MLGVVPGHRSPKDGMRDWFACALRFEYNTQGGETIKTDREAVARKIGGKPEYLAVLEGKQSISINNCEGKKNINT